MHHPIWGFVYDRTVHALAPEPGFSLPGLAEPRLEPEIIFGLARAPSAGMGLGDVLGCLAWVAHGFEIVQSIYRGRRFSPADTVAAYGLHGALFVGPRHPITATDFDRWLDALSSFRIRLRRNGEEVDQGGAANVLDGPLSPWPPRRSPAADPLGRPLEPGEIVTTGMFTRAFPVFAGETWSTALDGIALELASIGFAP